MTWRDGARGGGRTRMALRPGDFKSPVSTSFTTRARRGHCAIAPVPSGVAAVQHAPGWWGRLDWSQPQAENTG